METKIEDFFGLEVERRGEPEWATPEEIKSIWKLIQLLDQKKEITKLCLETGAFLPACIILTPAEKANRRKEVTRG
jgi:hypothetical protein